MLVVNAPTFFIGVWATISRFIDERTNSKVEIIGAKETRERLLKVVDID